jgi:hypothetical protein
MTELPLPSNNKSSIEESGIGLTIKGRRCLNDTFKAERTNEEPIAKKSRSFFEFDRPEQKLLKSGLNSSPTHGTILESKVSNKTASFFLVDMVLEEDDTRVNRKVIFNKLRAIDDSLECLVSMFKQSDSKRKFQVLLDTSSTRQKRCQSLTVYNWVRAILLNLLHIERLDIDSASVERKAFNIIVQQPKDRLRAIRKATEFDFDPQFTFIFSQHEKFSENYQIEHWARAKKDSPFDMCDNFVRQSSLNHSVGYLRSYLEQYQEKRKQGSIDQQKNEEEKQHKDNQQIFSTETCTSSTLVESNIIGASTKICPIEGMTSVLNRSLSFSIDL